MSRYGGLESVLRDPLHRNPRRTDEIMDRVCELLRRSAMRVHSVLDRNRVELSIIHISGPKRVELSDAEVALVLVGKNVEFFLPHYFQHHQALGIDCFMFLDNGSSDRSVEIARDLPKTIVAKCNAHFGKCEALIRYFANTQYIKGGWRLTVDADELFEFPGTEHVGGLPGLINVLNSRGYTGLVAQMLDLGPSGQLSALQNQLSALQNKNYEQAIRLCNNYSLGDITVMDYHTEGLPWSYFMKKNVLDSIEVKVLLGGLRKSLFGENCCLTKHPLFKMGAQMIPQPHPHVSTGLRIADFTALLKHYKFAGDFLDRERRYLQDQRGAAWEIEARINTLAENPNLTFLLPTSRFNPCINKLIDSNFLVASDSARRALGLK